MQVVKKVLHILVVLGVFVCQIIQQLNVDQNISNLPDISSGVAMACLAIIILLHLVSLASSDPNKESEAMKVARNFLGGAALVFEFIALGLRHNHLQDDNLIIAGVVVGLLCLLRLLDTILDHKNLREIYSVQCIEGVDGEPLSMRLVTIHVLLVLAAVFDIWSLVRAEEGQTPGNDREGHHWANKTLTTGEIVYSDSRWDNQVRNLSIATLTFLLFHLLLYPINRFICNGCGCAPFFIEMGLNACNCFCKETQKVRNERCEVREDKEEMDALMYQQNESNETNKNRILVAISRIPFIRQLVATFILSGLSYVAGATYGVQESQFRIAALVAYSAYDIIGRNKL